MACAAATTSASNRSQVQSTDNRLTIHTIFGIKKRQSHASERFLATAAAMLKVIGISSSTRKHQTKKNNSKNNDKNSTMPAMPKEKSSTVAENNFSELKLKERFSTDLKGMCSMDQTSTVQVNTAATQATDQQLIAGKTDIIKNAAINTSTKGSTASNIQSTQITSSSSSSSSSSTITGTETTITTTTASTLTSRPMTIHKRDTQTTDHYHRQPAKRTANDFRFGKSIGEGSFSTVYLAKDIYTKKEYAIKVCEKQLIIREKKQDYIKREREVMHLLSNVPGFVNLYCTFQDYKSLYFVMTYAKNGDLLPYIQKVGSFDHKSTQFYAAELVLALENMHKRGIIHRDLKPENILFDEKMHTLIADFGSAKILTPAEQQHEPNEAENFDKNRKRTNSFVGTAQYVSPEILTGQRPTRAADLWALGCIIYQMISGLPPFRAGTEYLIFQKILKLDLSFPDGFEKTAKDLVEKLLQIEPYQRLGADNIGDRYDSIRTHPFFDGIDWDNLRTQTPPPIHSYLPGLFDDDDDDLLNQYKVPDHLEPGLDDRQLTRLLGIELGTSVSTSLTKESKNILNMPDYERQQRIEAQKADEWHQFVDGEVILKKGFVNKRKGLFARKRMLLLTTGPRMVYVDPVQMVKKGEIPWSSDLKVEPKTFKIFFVHTPNRTYYLEDPEGYALEWCKTIEDVRRKTYET